MWEIEADNHRTATPPFTIEELWQAYHVSRDAGFLNQLIVHYLPIANRMARQMAARLGSCAEMEDLMQHGVLGLREAINSFNPTRGVAFEAYCGLRVRGAMLDFLRRNKYGPRQTREDFMHHRVWIHNPEEPDADGLDLLKDTREVDPSEPPSVDDLREFLLRGLSDTERHVVMLYYYEQLSFREIANALELCESRVCQVHARVLQRLRERLHQRDY